MGKAQTPVGDVFRVETMTGNVDVFKTYRPAEGGLKISCNGDGCAGELPICVAELAQRANERYLDAFAPLDDSTRMAELIALSSSPANMACNGCAH